MPTEEQALQACLFDTFLILRTEHCSISFTELSGEIFDDGLGYTTLSYANGASYYDYHKANSTAEGEAARANPGDVLES